jgi:hypothetical protein
MTFTRTWGTMSCLCALPVDLFRLPGLNLTPLLERDFSHLILCYFNNDLNMSEEILSYALCKPHSFRGGE